MFGAIARLARPAVGAVLQAGRAVNRSPAGTALKAVPGLGTVLGVAGGAAALAPLFGGGSKGGLPALPGAPAGGFPGLPGAGDRSLFRNDPNIAAALQGFAIPAAGLKPYFRAPKGFVVLRDEKGDPFGLPKVLAKKFYGWKEPSKPPISAGDWNKLKGAERVIDRFRDMEKRAKKIANFGTRRAQPRNIVVETRGRQVIGRKAA